MTTPARPAQRRDDPAASMALLTSLLRDVELDYPDRPVAGRPARPGPVRVVVLVAALAVLAMILTVGLVQRRDDASTQARARAALVDRVEAQTAQVMALQDELTAMRARISVDEQAALARSATGTRLAAQIASLEAATGLTPVVGPGVRLVVQDAEVDPATNAPPEGGRVLDQDLQGVVNGLWQAGAESIALNGHRLTATSAIRAAGEAILVDLRPLLPPYSVEAVGEPDGLAQRFEQSASDETLRNLAAEYGIRWHLSTDAELALPAAPGPVGDVDADDRRRAARVIAALGLVIGIILGVVLQPSVPLWLQPYLPIAVVAALDAVFGAIRALLDGIFDDRCSSSRSCRTSSSPRCSCSSATSSASARSCPPASSSSSAMRIFSNVAAIRRRVFHA